MGPSLALSKYSVVVVTILCFSSAFNIRSKSFSHGHFIQIHWHVISFVADLPVKCYGMYCVWEKQSWARLWFLHVHGSAIPLLVYVLHFRHVNPDCYVGMDLNPKIPCSPCHTGLTGQAVVCKAECHPARIRIIAGASLYLLCSIWEQKYE